MEAQPLQAAQPHRARAGGWEPSVPHVRQLVECKDAFVCDIATGNDLQLLQALLEVAGLAEPLQTLVLDVHALLQLDICDVLQAICKGKGGLASESQCWLLSSQFSNCP